VAGRLGVLVAGGRGRRMGLGFPKALLPLAGRTLLERGMDVLAATCDRMVVAAPAGMALPLAPALRADDPPGAEGPLAGLVAGLVAQPFEVALVLGVDFPLMTPGALERLAAALDGAAAAIPMPGGVPQPLAAAYGPQAVPALAAALGAGERAPTRAVMRLAPRYLDDGALAALPGGRGCFLNLNRAAQIEEVERALAAARTGGGG
jgi:molybdopterin-guanine dinucleotide biosynthesis protein A